MAKGGSAPAPTPPGETAKADYGADVASAGFGMQHGTPNQYSPGGSVTYDKYNLPEQSLGNGQTVPGGQGVSGVHTDFSPEFQSIFDTLTSKGGSLAGLLPSGGFNPNIDSSALRQSYINEGMSDVTPQWQRDDQAFNVLASERGIPIGSEIWDNERNRTDEQRGDYVQSLTNQAHSAAAADEARQFSQQLTEHNVPFSDFSNFYNSVQGMQAGLQGRDSPLVAASAPNVDVAGITARYDQQNLANWQAKQQASSAGMGSLLQFGGGLLGMLSDERAKEDIAPIGETYDGQQIYSYSYKADPEHNTHIGLMAQEVEKVHPEAVNEVGGVKFVNYGKATSLSSMLRAGMA
jgi:hypothetical protein